MTLVDVDAQQLMQKMTFTNTQGEGTRREMIQTIFKALSILTILSIIIAA